MHENETPTSNLRGNPLDIHVSILITGNILIEIQVHSEEGLPHERIFAMACRVGEHYVEIGRGKSKKLAKRQAAALMAERLKNIPSETSNVYDFEEDDDRIVERIVSLLQKKGSSPKSEQDGTLLSKCQEVALNKFSDLQVCDSLESV